MAEFSTLKTKILAHVTAQTAYFASGSVFAYEPAVESVVADPWAVVIASGNENDYISTAENRRRYAFTVRIFVERGSDQETAETKLMGIVEALLEAFDEDFTLTSSALYLTAAPSAWGYLLREKEYRYAEIRLVAKTDVSVQ